MRATCIDETEEGVVVVEQLRDDIVGSRINFALQHLYILLHIGASICFSGYPATPTQNEMPLPLS